MARNGKANVSTESASTASCSRTSSKSSTAKSTRTRNLPAKTIAKTSKAPAKTSAKALPAKPPKTVPDSGAFQVLSNQVNELLAKSSKTDAAISQVSEQVIKLEDGGVKNLEDTIMGVKRHLMSFG